MRNEVLFTVATLLVVGVLGASYFASITNTRNTYGLELNASVNATSIHVGQSLGINVSLYNSLPVTLNLSTTVGPPHPSPNNFEVYGLPIEMWQACLVFQPVEFILVRGNYSISELQTASANSSTTVMCGEGGWVFYMTFYPESSEANLTGRFLFSPYRGSANLTAIFTVNGFWTYPINSSEGTEAVEPPLAPIAQHPFMPGWYTLVVADEWGQTVIIRFSVT